MSVKLNAPTAVWTGTRDRFQLDVEGSALGQKHTLKIDIPAEEMNKYVTVKEEPFQPSYVMIEPEAILITDPNPVTRIETIGRTCYKSEDKITPESGPKFINMLQKREHGAMLEHAQIQGVLPPEVALMVLSLNKHLRVRKSVAGMVLDPDEVLVAGNIRAWRDLVTTMWGLAEYNPLKRRAQTKEYEMAKMLSLFFGEGASDGRVFEQLRMGARDLAASLVGYNPVLFGNLPVELDGTESPIFMGDITTPDDYASVRFICSRGVSHEYVRHRAFSFAQESTRYCDYIKAQFPGVMVIPTNQSYGAEVVTPLNTEMQALWEESIEVASRNYLMMRQPQNDVPPQFARDELPTTLKTELIMTGSFQDWESNFLWLRQGGGAHPHARLLANAAVAQFANWEYFMERFPKMTI